MRLIQWTSQMTTQTLILRVYFLTHIGKQKELIILSKLQIIVVLTPGIVADRFLAYNLQSMYRKRCDRPLQCLTALCGREVQFKSFTKYTGSSIALVFAFQWPMIECSYASKKFPGKFSWPTPSRPSGPN